MEIIYNSLYQHLHLKRIDEKFIQKKWNISLLNSKSQRQEKKREGFSLQIYTMRIFVFYIQNENETEYLKSFIQLYSILWLSLSFLYLQYSMYSTQILYIQQNVFELFWVHSVEMKLDNFFVTKFFFL